MVGWMLVYIRESRMVSFCEDPMLDHPYLHDSCQLGLSAYDILVHPDDSYEKVMNMLQTLYEKRHKHSTRSPLYFFPLTLFLGQVWSSLPFLLIQKAMFLENIPIRFTVRFFGFVLWVCLLLC